VTANQLQLLGSLVAIRRLLDGAARHIADAKVKAISAETLFSSAYTAIRQFSYLFVPRIANQRDFGIGTALDIQQLHAPLNEPNRHFRQHQRTAR
jgi:hypothetical protein